MVSELTSQGRRACASRCLLSMRGGAWLVALAAVALCPRVARAEGDLTVTTKTEVTGYQDSDAVSVITPGGRVNFEGATTGWSVGASFLVDVVTAASADIVATASPKWTDVRYVPGLDVGFKVDDVKLTLGAAGSIESDYFAGGGSFGLSADLADKTITPALSYSFGYDLAGRRDTPLSVYGLKLQRHALNGSIAFVVNKSTVFVPAVSAMVEIGDMEKPYRFLPTFSEGTDVAAGASVDEVNQKRTSLRLGEEAPDLRHRYAASGLLAHRFGAATIRFEERLYADSWMLLASTTSFMLPVDVSESFRIWPRARVHVQKGVSFWESAYKVAETTQGYSAPALRVGDRELGPMLTATLGGGMRISADTVGFSIEASAIYSRFFDHLFIENRLAGFAAVGFDARFE